MVIHLHLTLNVSTVSEKFVSVYYMLKTLINVDLKNKLIIIVVIKEDNNTASIFVVVQ